MWKALSEIEAGEKVVKSKGRPNISEINSKDVNPECGEAEAKRVVAQLPD
jgi:hypothetical protein